MEMQLIIYLKTSLWHADRAKCRHLFSKKARGMRQNQKETGRSEKKKDSLIFQHFCQKYECVHLHTSALFHNCNRLPNVHHACIYSPAVQCCACNAYDALKQSPLHQQCKMLKFPAVKMPFPPHKDTVTDDIPVSHAPPNQAKMMFCTNKSSIQHLLSLLNQKKRLFLQQPLHLDRSNCCLHLVWNPCPSL